MGKGQQKYRADWDATDGRNEGAQRTVWEANEHQRRVQLERMCGRAAHDHHGYHARVK